MRKINIYYRSGFTLLEIMLVVSIIGLLVAIAIPSFMKHRQHVEDVTFMNDMRLLLASLERQAITEGDYPDECPAGIVPRGFIEYMPRHFDWSKKTSIGGYWDWEHKIGDDGEIIGLAVRNPNRTTIQMKAIDAKLDDGSIYTGSFRRQDDGYIYIITE